MPSVPNTGCPNMTVNAGSALVGRQALKPGCYGNLVLNGHVQLQPGDYVLNSGSLIIGGDARVSCSACTFFLTSDQAGTQPSAIGKLKIDSGANVQLSAPSTGEHAGTLVYQDRRATPEVVGEENLLSGGRNAKLEGTIYFPSQSIAIDGTSEPDMSCTRVVGRRLLIKGRVVIAKDCSVAGETLNFTAAQIRLVG